MAVITVGVGPKRVALTAYCPDDELGLAACEYVLARVAEMFAQPVSREQFRAYLIKKDPEYTELFRLLDAGWRLPKSAPFPVDPRNVKSELRIIQHLMREQIEQRGDV